MISLIIAVYLIRVAISLYNIVRDPLPHPADAILLSVFFYNAPLAFISIYDLEWMFPEYKIFLNMDSKDTILAEKTIICCFLSMLGLEIGRRLFVGSSKPKTYLVMDDKFSTTSLSAMIGVSLFVFLGAYSMGFSNYFSGYGIDSNVANISDYIAFIYFCIEAIGIFYLLVFVNDKFGNRNFIIISLTLFILFMIVMAVARGKRLELIVALLPLMLLFWSVKLRGIAPRAIAVGMFMLVFSSLASLRHGELPTVSSLLFNMISEGLYAGHMTPGVVAAIDDQGMPPEYGVRLFVGLIAIIPRFIFPQKDEIVYQSISDISEFTPLGATSLLGEVYLQGGLIFTFFAFMALGFVSQILEVKKLYDRNENVFPIKSIYYLIFIGTFVFHFRDGIIAMTKLTIQMVILVSVFRLFLVHTTLNSPALQFRAFRK